MSKKQVSSTRILLVATFFIFCVLTYLFPYTGDDWDWGTQLGLNRLDTFFQDYNGRYLGNLLVIGLTRSKFLNILVMAAAYTFSIWACHRYSENCSIHSLLLAIILFFLMPKSIFAESIVWTSGFANYVPSVLTSITYILLFQKTITENKIPVFRKHFVIVTFLLGVSGALFIENITLFNICLATAVIGYTWYKLRKWSTAQIGFLLGSVVGAAIMFSNSAYTSVVNDTDEYRNLALTGYEAILYIVKHANTMADYLIYDNILFCGIISSLVSVLIWKYREAATSENKRLSAIIWLVHLFSLLLAVFVHFFPEAPYKIPCDLGLFPFLMDFTLFLIALIYLVSVWVAVLLFVPRDQSFHILMPLYCVPVAMAPLLIVEPFGPRCVFAGYLFMMLFTVALYGYIQKEICQSTNIRRYICIGLCSAMISQILYFGFIFSTICYWNVRRSSYMTFQSEKGRQIIYLCRLPWEEYLHNSSPTEYYLTDMFKLYHGLDENTTLEIVSQDELNRMIQQEK